MGDNIMNFFKNTAIHQQAIVNYSVNANPLTAQKMNFSIKDFFSKCDEIRYHEISWSSVSKRYENKQIFPKKSF